MQKLILLTVLIFSFHFVQAQNTGVIYSQFEADSIYGLPETSIRFVSSDLYDLTFQTNDYMMFRVLDDLVTILGDNRTVIFPIGSVVQPEDKFRLFSVSLVRQLIEQGGAIKTYIEMRPNEVLSISNGDYTLEYGTWCPPVCP